LQPDPRRPRSTPRRAPTLACQPPTVPRSRLVPAAKSQLCHPSPFLRQSLAHPLNVQALRRRIVGVWLNVNGHVLQTRRQTFHHALHGLRAEGVDLRFARLVFGVEFELELFGCTQRRAERRLTGGNLFDVVGVGFAFGLRLTRRGLRKIALERGSALLNQVVLDLVDLGQTSFALRAGAVEVTPNDLLLITECVALLEDRKSVV